MNQSSNQRDNMKDEITKIQNNQGYMKNQLDEIRKILLYLE